MIWRSNSRICAFNIRSCAPKGNETRPGNHRYALVLSLGDDRKQLFNPVASYWRNDPGTRPCGARIAFDSAEVCWRMKSWRGASRRSYAARASWSSTNRMLALVTASQMASALAAIVLLPLDVRLHISRRHQAHGMPKLLSWRNQHH